MVVCASEDGFLHVDFEEAEAGGEVGHATADADGCDFFVEDAFVLECGEVLDGAVVGEEIDVAVAIDDEELVGFAAVGYVADAYVAERGELVVGAYFAVVGVVGEEVAVHE